MCCDSLGTSYCTACWDTKSTPEMWNSGLLSISIHPPVWQTFPVSDAGLHGRKPEPTGRTTQTWPGTWLGFDRRPAPYPCRIKALWQLWSNLKAFATPSITHLLQHQTFPERSLESREKEWFSENKDERLRARTGRRNPGGRWDPNHCPLLSFIRLFFPSGTTRAASAGPFPPALCWSSPAWLCPSPGSPWLAQQQVAVAVALWWGRICPSGAAVWADTNLTEFLWSAERKVFKLPDASRTPVLTQRSRAWQSNPDATSLKKMQKGLSHSAWHWQAGEGQGWISVCWDVANAKLIFFFI